MPLKFMVRNLIFCRSLPDHKHIALASTLLSSALTGWAAFIRFAYFYSKHPFPGALILQSIPGGIVYGRCYAAFLPLTPWFAPSCARTKHSRLPHRIHLQGTVRRNAFISAAKTGYSGFSAPPLWPNRHIRATVSPQRSLLSKDETHDGIRNGIFLNERCKPTQDPSGLYRPPSYHTSCSKRVWDIWQTLTMIAGALLWTWAAFTC